jgi:hypothetical protein
VCLADGHGTVGGERIDHQYLIGYIAEPLEAAGDIGFFIEGDDDDGEQQGGHWGKYPGFLPTILRGLPLAESKISRQPGRHLTYKQASFLLPLENDSSPR